jgi:proteasome lid subunit RPN8/RPN11
MNISSKTIKIMKDFVYDLEYEVCGNLFTQGDTKEGLPNELFLHNIQDGEKVEYSTGQFRGACKYKSITTCIFHSHPATTYSYPSVEDIMQLLEYFNNTKHSIIATKWGIWDISNTLKSNVYSSNCKDQLNKYIRECVDYYIGYPTRDDKNDWSRDITDKDLDLINIGIKKIEEVLHIKINLHLWDDLNNGLVIDK